MTKSDFAKLGKRLLPGFRISGNFYLISPFSRTVRGFLFEPSAFSKTHFYVNAFFLPLCVPIKQLHVTFGHRLGSPDRWSFTDTLLLPNLSKELETERAFLFELDKPADVAMALRPFAEQKNPHSMEALAYTLILAGQIEAGTNVLNDLLSGIDKSSPWQQEIAMRAAKIHNTLRDQPESARQQLALWESETVNSLGLAKFLAPSTTNTSIPLT